MLVIPVKKMILVPNANIYFQTDFFRDMAGRITLHEKVVFLMQRDDRSREELDDNSFFPIAVSGVIDEINPGGYVGVHTNNRVDVSEVHVNYDGNIEIEISKRADINDISFDDEAMKLDALKEETRRFAKGKQWGGMVEAFMTMIHSVEEMGAGMSFWIPMTQEERYAILETDSRAERINLIEKTLYEYLEVAKVTSDAHDAQEKEYQSMYKEAAIKKQMEYLQKELDEMHPENVDDIRRFELAIEDSGMNNEARKEAEKVLNRMKQEGKNSPETGMLYDYLDFITSLSWRAEDPEPTNLAEAKRILDEDHYGLKKVKKRVIQQIAVMNRKKEDMGSILLFVGAPGTGKTSIGKSIAKALGREYVRVSLGGVRDEADIRGHRRTYIGAMPGRIMNGIAKSGVKNPVMVLDEVDKLAASYNGDPASALLEVLDPEQNNTFADHYMNVPYDLSQVVFVCTANTTDTIPEPLLNRMEVIRFDGYTPLEKLSIAKEHLLPRAMKEMGIEEGELLVPDEIIETIISEYTREAGVRGLRKRMDTLCRGAAVMLEEKGKSVSITKENLRDELDMRPMHRERVPKSQKPGVVTGMAWTPVGGEILYIETLHTRGDGKIIITGQLGDVMKESAQIAVSLVKSMFPECAQKFKENDIHIHVPEGAVPKDGPSAGITMTTAIASLITGRSVDPSTAMTGEVSLRGVVSPIGGLPEKLMAAQRAGVKTAFIPKENTVDLKDVAEEVKEELDIIPVESVEEVLIHTGILDEKKVRAA
ncbi:MAG: endopeptidase La [Lachnospiraceae bacterium]|nr:endopeptidase La [Lachnospiraceae bacterium]